MKLRNYYKMITVKAAQDLNELLIEAAEDQNVTVSELIRKCCVAALKAEDPVKHKD